MKREGTKKRRPLRNAWVLLFALAWVILPFALNKTVVQADDLSDEIRIRASLTGPAINGITPSGFAEHRTETGLSDGRVRLDVDVFSVNLPAGTVLNVVLNNAVIGQVTLDGFGNAFFRRDTNDGQTVPPASNGNPIAVMNGNTTIVSGVFGIVTATPSPSGSPTGSPTASPSVSPTGSPNPSPSVSPTGSPNPSPSVSPTGSPNPSPTVSPSPNGSPNPSPSPNGNNLFAGLNGPTLNGVLPNGYAEYEFHSSRIELEVRVNQVNLPGGTMLTVAVNNATAGQMFISSGEGRLRLRSDDGQNVPVVVPGSTITVYNGSAAILTGIFFNNGPSPSPSPSASPSPTGSPNPSPSVSPTASPTGSPNPSPTVSPSPNESPSPSPSPNASPSPSPSPAQGRYFEGHLSGSQVQPPVTTGSRGELKVFLNANETQAQVTGEFNLSSQQTSAKILVDIGSANVIYDFGVIGGTQGRLTATFNVTPAQVQQLRTGLWYAVVGSANNPTGEVRGAIRYDSRSSDFDGDGVNDIAVFRPSDGNWYIQNSNGFSAQTFGGANDKLVSGDFDGDGRSDTAVYRSVNGAGLWDIKRSSDGGSTTEQFGLSTDIPVRGDFDGDGRQDLAVFRPSNGYWYVKKTSDSGYIIVQFGQNGDKPVAADLDGDGKTDIAVFRPSAGDWYWLGSRDGLFRGLHFGVSEDLPIAGDFDGDGRDDLTVYRPSVGSWYRINSSNEQFVAIQFGISTDVPVAGDYDRDGKTDIAVFRKADGAWYILRSSDGAFEARFFGLNGDIPIPAQ
jgi:hypothetical protein